MLTAALGFAAAFALIFARVPIAVALLLTGFAGFATLSGLMPSLSMIAASARDSVLSYNLAVIPLFVLMGNLVAGAGISQDLFRAAQVLIGRRRGGLAMATIVASGGFGAICGSSVATALTIGKVSLPSMRKYGYSEGLSAAAVAAGGTLGILIPPSVIMVVYGVSTETHIGKLFMAGIIPGIIGVLGYMLAVRWVVWRDPSAAPITEKIPKEQRDGLFKGLVPVIVLFGLVLGGIYGGLFTPTEASGIGAFGAFLFALGRRVLTREAIRSILSDSAQTTAMMFAILLGATVFGEFINLTGVHKALLDVVQDATLQPFTVILIIIGIYILLGCILESLSIILLTVPLLFPVVTGLGYDPVWFGIIVVVATEIGLITPPIGINLFVIQSLVPNLKLSTLVKGILPFVTADIVRILMLAAVPALSLWLPNRMF
ncbi:MAG: TRAP transporter large permease [Hydrogenophaga sp.]|uniref:TRAP transporter large permease n=1 Tax=Hydrogenophaga sp. TaxID=1904254 RepID=UPI003D10C69C